MDKPNLGHLYLKDIEVEAAASRKCLERVPADKFNWKPHEKSMEMGQLALIVAEVPRWISTAIEVGVINFGSFRHAEVRTGLDLVAEFNGNLEDARKALENISDEEMLNGVFSLKMGDTLLMSGPKLDTVSSSIRHWIHHRGQLTVYLRLCDIPVPEIYGPSADEGKF